MGVAVGIDLGTSNSVVAYFEKGSPYALADTEGRTVHPSVVAYGYGQSAVVGYRAKQQMSYAPENTIFSAKRLIGRHFSSPEIQRMRKMASWGIVEGPNKDARIRVQGRVYTPQEVSAHVLKHLKEVAEKAIGKTVDKAVITVPAYFNDQQRQATRDAAEIAGLHCLRILNEPTAAALAYGYKKDQTQQIAVYDLGGGTFDISILRIDDDFFEVLSTSGDTFLGGDDFDWAIASELMDFVQKEHNIDLSKKYVAQAKLLKAAEEAKIVLSSQTDTTINIPSLTRSKEGDMIHLEYPINRRIYRKLVTPLIQRSLQVVESAIKEAGLSKVQIENALMVGGMTRSPLVREKVSQFFGTDPIANLNPDEVVALGAAIQAHNLSQQGGKTVLVDVTPQSLGILTQGGFVRHIIEKNTSVPIQKSDIFTTIKNDQTEVRIKVYQGEGFKVEENTFLGEFVLSDLRKAKRGEIPIRVCFHIDADGILQVSATNEETGKQVKMNIEDSNQLTSNEKSALRTSLNPERK